MAQMKKKIGLSDMLHLLATIKSKVVQGLPSTQWVHRLYEVTVVIR